jgi:hypothetical protein
MSMTNNRKVEMTAAAIYAQGVNNTPVDTRTKEEIFGNRVVRVETVRRPYVRREWEGGKARRTSFSGCWTKDGCYHDLD